MADNNSLNDSSAGSNSSNPSDLSGNSIVSLLFHATVNELEPIFDKIRLPQAARDKSKRLVQTAFSHGIFSSDPKIPNPEIFASILYMSVIEKSAMSDFDSNGHLGYCTTLTDILMATNVNINKMFPVLQAIMEKVQVSDALSQHFHNLKQRYCVISLLFHKFEKKCGDAFKKETSENDENESVASPIRKSEGVDCRKKFCWVLFLLTKYHLLPNSSELYLHIQILLCCLEYVLSKTPMFLLNSPYASIRFRHASPCAGESMLEKLAKDFDVNFEETQALYVNSIEPYFNDLSDSDGDIDLLSLCEMYREISTKAGALNELLFLTNDARIMPHQASRDGSGSSTGQSNLKPGQMTPIRGTLTAVHQLEKLLRDLKEEPGARLAAFMKKCNPDPTDAISDLVTEMKGKFLAAYRSQCEPGSSQNALGQQRLSQGTKLFYKVMESVIIKNSDRPTEAVITSLLKKDIFVMSAFAFSMEIILATYGQRYDPKTRSLTFGDSLFPFPWILKVMSLHAYKFDIMMENFIPAVESLSPDIIKYLHSICNQILDKLVWEEDSPVFDALSHSEMSPVKGYNGQTSTALNSVELLLSPAPSSMPSDRLSALTAPTDRLSALASSLSSPSSSSSTSADRLPSLPSPPSQGRAILPPPPPLKRSQSLAAFLTKVGKLGFSRITALSNSLDLSERVKDMIWTCFDYCLRENFTLLKNRHIDQIIICCVRGVCRALNLKVRLENVVDQYKLLPFAKPEVLEKVFMSDKERSSIAEFYRTVFVDSKTSDKTLQFAQASADIPPLSPRPKMVWNSPRPCTHLGKPNLTISPMHNHSVRSPSKFCSSIGSATQSPTFKMINEKMSMKSKSIQRTVKRLDFDNTSQQTSDFKQRKLDSCKLPFS